MSPTVSVVLAVRDEAKALDATISSILCQEGVDFELIVVDDGSSDGTRELLRSRAATDPRILPVDQEAEGLTAALIRGCELAQGELVARQDAGDRSLPGRLAALAAELLNDPTLALTSGGTRFVGPKGEFLYEVTQGPEEAAAGLHAASPKLLRGPSIHGCTMFRRSAYQAVGGYREQFRVAQDMDLWLRLSEFGGVSAMPRILYEAVIGLRSITALRRAQQVEATRIAWWATELRRSGRDERPALDRARAATTAHREESWRSARKAEAGAAYFVGSCLAGRDRRAARWYFARATRSNPFHLKAWIRWLTTAL